MEKEKVFKTLNNKGLENYLIRHLNRCKKVYKQPPEVSREEVISKNLFNKDKVNKELILNGYKPIFEPLVSSPNIKPHSKVCVDTHRKEVKGENTNKKEVILKPKRIEKRKSLKVSKEYYDKLISINPQPFVAFRLVVDYYLQNHKNMRKHKKEVVKDEKEVR